MIYSEKALPEFGSDSLRAMTGKRPRGRPPVDSHRIFEAARAVFLADPAAPLSKVAARAGVGMSVLYRVYTNKEGLLRELSLDGLRRSNAAIEATIAEGHEPWEAFCTVCRRALDAEGGSLSRKLAGRYAVTEELRAEGLRTYTLTEQVLARARNAGALRPEVTFTDIQLLLEIVQSVGFGSSGRVAELKRRYLEVVLAGLHSSSGPGLPHTAPTFPELAGRYEA
jgi:AcrR family transcriptional regulator